jgi:hypothetical protein
VTLPGSYFAFWASIATSVRPDAPEPQTLPRALREPPRPGPQPSSPASSSVASRKERQTEERSAQLSVIHLYLNLPSRRPNGRGAIFSTSRMFLFAQQCEPHLSHRLFEENGTFRLRIQSLLRWVCLFVDASKQHSAPFRVSRPEKANDAVFSTERSVAPISSGAFSLR